MSISRIEKVSYAAGGFGAALVRDLAKGASAVTPFFPSRSWREVVQEIDAHSYPREELAAVLEQAAREFNAPQPVLENIRLLKEPRTYAVLTGQQAGFLGGPLYTLHKALSAVSFARQLTAEANGEARFVPVFWVAGDDHDLGEIDHADLLKPEGDLLRVRAALTPESRGCSACDAFADAGQFAALEKELEQVLPTEFVERQFENYRGHSFADAFTRLFYEWLGEFGLILAPSQKLRRFGRELLLRELEDYPTTARLIEEVAIALRASEYEPGFDKGLRVAPHFFIVDEGSRIRARLEPDGGRFHERSPAFEARGEKAHSYSRIELAELIRRKPELFSCSAALRPILQQQIFPAVATILGPGEIAYWAQLREVCAHFGAVWPMIVPRATITLLDAQGAKAVRKLGLEASPEIVLKDGAALARHAAVSSELGAKVEARRKALMTEFDALATEVQETDRGLQPLFAKSRERIEHELERIAEKTRASLEQRVGAEVVRVRYLNALVKPKGQPQERVLSAAQFIASYPGMPGELLAAISPLSPEHLVVTL